MVVSYVLGIVIGLGPTCIRMESDPCIRMESDPFFLGGALGLGHSHIWMESDARRIMALGMDTVMSSQRTAGKRP